MSDKFLIPNVPYLTQRDNANQPFTSCFNTSNAMCIQHCLNLIDKTKADIGCSNENMQLEDYLFEFMNSKETTDWMKANTKIWGTWIWDYSRRTVYPIEAWAFNHFMNDFGFKATFREDLTYDTLCNFIEVSNLPCIIGGDFSSLVSSVQGHMNVFVGFNKTGMKELITKDPFGNALKYYKDFNGDNMSYGTKYFVRKNGIIRTVTIECI